jgi:hypothetical protein
MRRDLMPDMAVGELPVAHARPLLPPGGESPGAEQIRYSPPQYPTLDQWEAACCSRYQEPHLFLVALS